MHSKKAKVLLRDDFDYEVSFPAYDVWHGFGYGYAIFVTGVMECNKSPIVFVNAGGCDRRSSQISAYVFNGDVGSEVLQEW